MHIGRDACTAPSVVRDVILGGICDKDPVASSRSGIPVTPCYPGFTSCWDLVLCDHDVPNEAIDVNDNVSSLRGLF